MSAAVPWFVWVVAFGANLTLVSILVVAVRRHGSRRRAAGVAAVLAAWFVLAVVLSAAGAFVAGAGRPPTIGLGVFPPILAGALALAFSKAVRDAALAIPQPWIVGVQSLRVLGVVFLVLLARGVLPTQFALPAGWGDLAIGAAAPAVAFGLSRARPWARRVAVAWNVLGILDLAVAIGMGALSAESTIRIFRNAPSTGAMAQLPLSMIPTFGVPIFVLHHVVSLLGLRARTASGAAVKPALEPSASPGRAASVNRPARDVP